MKYETIIGVDPGANGGIAWITDGKACVEKMPDTLQDLWELVVSISLDAGTGGMGIRAYLEAVSSSPFLELLWETVYTDQENLLTQAECDACFGVA